MEEGQVVNGIEDEAIEEVTPSRRYGVTIKGETPLLMKADSIEWADQLQLWKKTTTEETVAGDDRTPAWNWIGSVYHEGGRVVMPADNIMAMLRVGGTKTKRMKGIGSMKVASQSGLMVDQSSWPLLVDGKEIAWGPIKKLMEEKEFLVHCEKVRGMGFELFVKRASIEGKKHVRVRPRFEKWSVAGSITVFDSAIDDQMLLRILRNGMTYGGFGDWRPGSPRCPGPFGKGSVSISRLEETDV